MEIKNENLYIKYFFLLTLVFCCANYASEKQADIRLIGEYARDKNLAIELSTIQELAHRGDIEAQNNLGVLLQSGVVVEQNIPEAIKWFRLAAEQGSALTQSTLGSIYLDGTLVPVDYKQALKWFQMSALQGDMYAQNNLGSMLIEGLGGEPDISAGFAWTLKAAEQGLSVAQRNVGTMLYAGNGVAKDFVKSVFWYRKAAKQGEAEAQLNLGLMYYNGHGVDQDDLLAHTWFSLSKRLGNQSASRNLDGLKPFMSSKQKNKAIAIEIQCIESNYSDCGHEENHLVNNDNKLDAQYNIEVLDGFCLQNQNDFENIVYMAESMGGKVLKNNVGDPVMRQLGGKTVAIKYANREYKIAFAVQGGCSVFTQNIDIANLKSLLKKKLRLVELDRSESASQINEMFRVEEKGAFEGAVIAITYGHPETSFSEGSISFLSSRIVKASSDE